MQELQYFIVKAVSRLKREKHKETIHRYFRKQGMKLGEGVNICSNIVTTESHLIEIGDYTTVSANVTFITHDNSICKVLKGYSDLFGKIVIGKNCFIGSNAIVMYGVTLADHIIVAAGSVVTKSFREEGIIIGGNPARKISTWDAFADKNRDYAWNLGSITREQEIALHKDEVKLIHR